MEEGAGRGEGSGKWGGGQEGRHSNGSWLCSQAGLPLGKEIKRFLSISVWKVNGDKFFRWRLEAQLLGACRAEAQPGYLGGEVTKPAGRAGWRATCWDPVSPPTRWSPHTWMACLTSPAVVGGEGPGSRHVMDCGAVHLCHLRDCLPVSAASCAPLRSSWRRQLAAPWPWTRGHRTSTPRSLLGALEEGEAPSAGPSPSRCVRVCAHAGVWGTGV